jgi:hypothetical protein
MEVGEDFPPQDLPSANVWHYISLSIKHPLSLASSSHWGRPSKSSYSGFYMIF